MIKQIKSDLNKIRDSEESYDRATASAKMKIVQETQVLVNQLKLSIRNLEFEVKMLPIGEREEYMNKFKKI